MLNACVAQGSGSMLQLPEVDANMERAGCSFPPQLAKQKQPVFISTWMNLLFSLCEAKSVMFLDHLSQWGLHSWYGFAANRIYTSEETQGGRPRVWILTALFASRIRASASMFLSSPKTSDCPRHECLLRCALFLALNLMLIICLHLFAIQSELLFVLPENTLLHVACVYLLASRHNQCITLSPLRRFWLANYPPKWLIIKWNGTAVFLWFSYFCSQLQTQLNRAFKSFIESIPTKFPNKDQLLKWRCARADGGKILVHHHAWLHRLQRFSGCTHAHAGRHARTVAGTQKQAGRRGVLTKCRNIWINAIKKQQRSKGVWAKGQDSWC